MAWSWISLILIILWSGISSKVGTKFYVSGTCAVLGSEHTRVSWWMNKHALTEQMGDKMPLVLSILLFLWTCCSRGMFQLTVGNPDFQKSFSKRIGNLEVFQEKDFFTNNSKILLEPESFWCFPHYQILGALSWCWICHPCLESWSPEQEPCWHGCQTQESPMPKCKYRDTNIKVNWGGKFNKSFMRVNIW